MKVNILPKCKSPKYWGDFRLVFKKIMKKQLLVPLSMDLAEIMLENKIILS